MNAKTQAAVMAHGQNLIALFHLPKDTDPVTLCKKLRRLEREASNIGLRLCNGPEYPTEDAADIATERILDRVDKLIGFRALGIPVFVNRDPRGYALKIDYEHMLQNHKGAVARLHRDWGGYGIIAPDLTTD
jgi:hypothetical protein